MPVDTFTRYSHKHFRETSFTVDAVLWVLGTWLFQWFMSVAFKLRVWETYWFCLHYIPIAKIPETDSRASSECVNRFTYNWIVLLFLYSSYRLLWLFFYFFWFQIIGMKANFDIPGYSPRVLLMLYKPTFLKLHV